MAPADWEIDLWLERIDRHLEAGSYELVNRAIGRYQRNREWRWLDVDLLVLRATKDHRLYLPNRARLARDVRKRRPTLPTSVVTECGVE